MAVKILALSDIGHWNGCETLVRRFKPDVVVLAGDLTSDGGAAFWHEGLELVPEFRKQKRLLYRKLRNVKRPGEKCVICAEAAHGKGPLQKYEGGLNHIPIADHLDQLKAHYRNSEAFAAAHTKIHVNRFYQFLNYAAKRSKVLVTKGDHDDDFAGDYDPERIDKIPGCREVSGKLYEVGGLTFLGLGFEQAKHRRPLRCLVNEFRGRADVVIAHAPQKNLLLVTELRPRLLIRGHYGAGQHLIDGIPSVFTSFEYVLVELDETGGPRFRVVGYHSPLCRQLARTASASLRNSYPWLKPF